MRLALIFFFFFLNYYCFVPHPQSRQPLGPGQARHPGAPWLVAGRAHRPWTPADRRPRQAPACERRRDIWRVFILHAPGVLLANWKFAFKFLSFE